MRLRLAVAYALVFAGCGAGDIDHPADLEHGNGVAQPAASAATPKATEASDDALACQTSRPPKLLPPGRIWRMQTGVTDELVFSGNDAAIQSAMLNTAMGDYFQSWGMLESLFMGAFTVSSMLYGDVLPPTVSP